MALDLLGYHLTGTLEAIAVLSIVLAEGIVLYLAYTGYVRLARRIVRRSREGDAP